ncbi:helix-turn-helix domain-containing protein [Winogradskyella echinorum]|uniref:Helix-turn-helix domain-containing protein n=1 Tax=Winogradskyella echinorum TaxID=538189 RepID=A0ABR6Y0N2_9FLAO|nr:helix-turn-helix domain-containing protein [Winogradskyella echinorum]MBC3846306.1 helix-turn-helix domain-containing protein [Winogradskyella echinorum]MBC5750654.1 helix-turn-helix domain-containing protein [Winogradskyella echinorum]
MNDILRYKGLYGEQQLPFVTDFIHIEPLEERSRVYSWEIQEHFHTDLVQLFIIESGKGELYSEGEKMILQAPCVVTVPANVLHGFHFEPQITGDVITLSISFFETLLKDRPQIKNESKRLSNFTFEAHSEIVDEILYLKSKIEEELLIEASEKLLAITIYFELLYLQLYREKFRTTANALISNNRNLAYYQQFQDLIRQNSKDLPSIKKFAKAIGITQTHLNRVCQTVAEKSALKVVQDYTLNEAKKYLLNTSYSISEVAYFLNFNDPAYFNRLFKKRVGVTPGEFRKG